MQDINQIQALSLTQNLSLGTYLPSFPLNFLYQALSRLNGNSVNPGNSASLKNLFGFYRSDLSYKLLNYLGYGNIITNSPSSENRWWSTSIKNAKDSSLYSQQYIQNNQVNLFPLLAYQKIYQDFSVGRNGKIVILLPIMWIIIQVFLLRWFLLFLTLILRIGNQTQCLTSNIVTGTKIC
jgi:hypothetical protein